MNKEREDGNIRSKEHEPRSWNKKEMDEAKPYPLPEIDEDTVENDKEHEDKGKHDPC